MERPVKMIWIVIISFLNVTPFLLLAQNSPTDYLKVHNDARAEVGVKPLKWDPNLALHAHKFVKKHIEDCINGLSDVGLAGTYGQNNAYSSQSQTGAKAVSSWVKQKYNYDYKSNSCIDGTVNCGCYTQVVWDATTSLGCAKVECRNDEGSSLTTCLYYPEGNVLLRRLYKIR